MEYPKKSGDFQLPRELRLMYEMFPEDVAIAAQDAENFGAHLNDNLEPSDEPWPLMAPGVRK